MSNEYKVVCICPNRYEIVDSKGFAVYDDAPYGKDAPLFYRNCDAALSAVECLEKADKLKEKELQELQEN